MFNQTSLEPPRLAVEGEPQGGQVDLSEPHLKPQYLFLLGSHTNLGCNLPSEGAVLILTAHGGMGVGTTTT